MMTPQYISEREFSITIQRKLESLSTAPKSVSGPGRSGAIAAVYASHILNIPYIPYGQSISEKLHPLLIIDTASLTGKTLKKAMVKMQGDISLAVFQEESHSLFWYEKNFKG
jgi:hypothetical protein